MLVFLETNSELNSYLRTKKMKKNRNKSKKKNVNYQLNTN